MNIIQSDVFLSAPDDDEPTSAFDASTFDKHAGLYEKLALAPYRKILEIPTLEFYLGNLKGKRILDFGCGPGFFSRWLKDKGAEHVVGYDISKGMIDYTRLQEEKAPKDITYIDQLDSNQAGKFDIILAIYVIPYIPTQNELLTLFRTFAALLKPNGRLITLPLHPHFHPDPEFYRPYAFSLREHEPRKDGSIVQLHICLAPYDISLQTYYWSSQTLEDTVFKAGFEDMSWRPLRRPAGSCSKDELEFLQPYLQQPHVAIIECQLKFG